jgi:hypothetical protein
VSKKADNPQINVRVEPATMEIFEAAIYARRLRGPQELLGPVLEAFASRIAREPGIQAAIRGRQEADAHASGKLKQLGQKRGPGGDAN